MVPAVPALPPAPAAWWPWPCCHLQGISHWLLLAPGLWPALREGVPGPGSSETKGWGKKANRQVLEDFPQHDPRIKKAKQILHIKTTTLQCNIKDYLLKRLWMLHWEVFPSTDAPSSNSRSLQTSSSWRFITSLLQPKIIPKAEVCQRHRDGQLVPACQRWVLHCSKTPYPGTVTSKSPPFQLFTEQGPGGDLAEHP